MTGVREWGGAGERMGTRQTIAPSIARLMLRVLFACIEGLQAALENPQ